MAGIGPPPKAAGIRRRRNKKAAGARLPSEAEAAQLLREVPPLPEIDDDTDQWHPLTQAWWANVWRSPMAVEFLKSLLVDTEHGKAALRDLIGNTRFRVTMLDLCEVADAF